MNSKLDHYQPIYHSNLGNAYRDSGRCEQAIACYQKALQIKPENVAHI